MKKITIVVGEASLKDRQKKQKEDKKKNALKWAEKVKKNADKTPGMKKR